MLLAAAALCLWRRALRLAARRRMLCFLLVLRILTPQVRRASSAAMLLCRLRQADRPVLVLVTVLLVATRLCWRALASCPVPVAMPLSPAVAVRRQVAVVCSSLPVMETRVVMSSFAVVAVFRQRVVT